MVANNTSRDTPGRMDLPFVGLATFARQPACARRRRRRRFGRTHRYRLELSRWHAFRTPRHPLAQTGRESPAYGKGVGVDLVKLATE
jgi:hypothetical protein